MVKQVALQLSPLDAHRAATIGAQQAQYQAQIKMLGTEIQLLQVKLGEVFKPYGLNLDDVGSVNLDDPKLPPYAVLDRRGRVIVREIPTEAPDAGGSSDAAPPVPPAEG